MRVLAAPLLEGTLLKEQIADELEATEAGKRRYRELARQAVERGDGAALKPAERMLVHWLNPLVKAIREHQRHLRAGGVAKNAAIYGPPMLGVDAERLAVITMREAVGACMREPGGVLMPHIAYVIGRAVFAEMNMDLLRRRARDSLKQLERRCRRLSSSKVNWWAKRTLEDPAWEKQACAHLGVALLWMLISAASAAPNTEPFRLAFHHTKRSWHGRQRGFIVMDEVVFNVIEKGHEIRELIRPRYRPMLVQPCPWLKHAQGGYVRIRTPFISKPRPSQKAALATVDLTRVYECLNDVGSVPWRVNRRVLDVLRSVWAAEGGFCDVPKADNLPIPPRPPAADTDEKVEEEWKREASKTHRANVYLRADRMAFLNKLDEAERLKSRPRFYYPHQLDFRGRCYPVPPNLNHQGDDTSRGLLEFAEAKPPGERGYYNLKIHAANCYGIDKVPFAERLAWVNAHGEDIIRCATNPLEWDFWQPKYDARGHKTGGPDKPWQFLAACFALTFDDAAAHLPVQSDGTCNGLQQYAALGRDSKGAAAVNLTPGERPADVYADVAVAVRPLVQADAAGDKVYKWNRKRGDTTTAHSRPLREIASLVDERLKRSVVKPNVMTTVYGVTPAGARKQLLDTLGEAGLEGDNLYQGAHYLSNLVLRAVGDVCPGAVAIMDWLYECARLVTATGEPVTWTTPLGLPVVQAYRNFRTANLRTVMQKLTLVHEEETLPIRVGKHRNSFSPNYVHSIDATHMFMTASACRSAGVAFAAVHDAYWTHAETADQMGDILREQFVALHNRPLLQELVTEFRTRFPAIVFPDPPPAGDFDLARVRVSPYFFN